MRPMVQRPDEVLAMLRWPAPAAIQTLALGPDDTLVVCAGFEDRALAGLGMALTGSRRFHLVTVDYAPFLEKNREDRIRAIVADHPEVKFSRFLYDRESPAGFAGGLVEAIGERLGRVYIDISGMSRLLIVQTIVAFRKRCAGLKGCSLLYSEAAEYPPTKAEAEAGLLKSIQDPTFSALFLSSGVFEITVVPELSSVSPAPTQSRLVVFPAFDVHHLAALLAELQPSRLTFIEGTPPNVANAWRKKAIAELNHLDAMMEAERVSACTLRYEETLALLLHLYRKNGLRERLLVAPTGSKMQTVAVGLFRAFVEDVQIVYSTPRGFVSPDNYTKGVGPTYELPLDVFGVRA